MNFPTIEIKFTTHEDVANKVQTIFIRTIEDALNCARGDKDKLREIILFSRELKYMAETLLDEAENGTKLGDKELL